MINTTAIIIAALICATLLTMQLISNKKDDSLADLKAKVARLEERDQIHDQDVIALTRLIRESEGGDNELSSN